jgi:hypothetical protein
LRTKGSKYEPLNTYLKLIKSNVIVMTFSEIEKVLGFELPSSASKHQAWWDGSSQHTQAYAWTSADFKANPNLKERKVEFIKYQ